MNGLWWDLALAKDLHDGLLEVCEPHQPARIPDAPGEVKLFGMIVRKSTELPPGTFLRAEDLVNGKIILYETSPHGSLKATMIGEAFRKGEQ